MEAVTNGRDLTTEYAPTPPAPAIRGRPNGSPRLVRPARTPEPFVARMDVPVMMLAGADLLAFALSYGLGCWAAPGGAAGFLLPGAAASCALVMGYCAYRGHYTRRTPFWTKLKHLIAAGFIAAIAFSVAAFGTVQVYHGTVLALLVMFPAAALALRHALRLSLAAAGQWQIRTVLVGSPVAEQQATAALRSEPGLGYHVVAVLRPEEVGADRLAWRGMLGKHRARLALLSLDADQPLGREMVASLVRERIPFAIMPPLAGLPVLGYEQTRFFSHDTVLVSYRNNLAQPVARLLKLAFDVVAAAAGLVVASPVLLLIAALVKLDGGPVFYGHLRVGAGARPFRCLKFRSMVVDGDAVLSRALLNDPDAAAEWRLTNKLRRDPRITTVGRFLRSTSLDELPQLLNVLRGEMSLVGPRPIVQAEVVRYGEDITYYYETRPGLTGLWQVSGRTDTSYDRRVELDSWYVKNWTLWHDVAILAKTIPAVLKRQGAC